MIRCRNCAETDHTTAECNAYGPWYPELGKVREDYQEIADKVTELVAADILAEHEADHAHDEVEEVQTIVLDPDHPLTKQLEESLEELRQGGGRTVTLEEIKAKRAQLRQKREEKP